MILGNFPPPGKPGDGDPRACAFAELLKAIDHRDRKALQLATRQLRALGLSVCLTGPRAAGLERR